MTLKSSKSKSKSKKKMIVILFYWSLPFLLERSRDVIFCSRGRGRILVVGVVTAQ